MPGARRARSSLIVRDYDEAIAWFAEKLGFTLVADQPEQDKRWVVVAPREAGTSAATPLLASAATDQGEIGGRHGKASHPAKLIRYGEMILTRFAAEAHRGTLRIGGRQMLPFVSDLNKRVRKMNAFCSLLAGALLSSCGSPETNSSGSDRTPQQQGSAQAEPEFLPPEGIGAPLEQRALAASQTPDVVLDDAITGQKRTDMQALLDAAIGAMTSAEFRAGAQAINAKYPQVWLNSGLKYRTAAQVASIIASAPAPWTYARFPLVLTSRKGEGPITGAPNPRRAYVRIRIPEYVLRRWQAQNRVMKSCAVNTVAHEISHTVLTRDDGYFPVFTDTGASSAGKPAYGSYLTGSLAQCAHLQRQGRINSAGIAQCVPIWTVKNRKGKLVLNADACDDYEENEPVQ